MFVARCLKAQGSPRIAVAESDGDGAALIEIWEGARTVIVCDAVFSGAAPGTLHRFDARTGPLPATLVRHSTHAFGVAEAVTLARALGRLPPRLIVYGIEGMKMEAGVGLSSDVEDTAKALVERLLGEFV